MTAKKKSKLKLCPLTTPLRDPDYVSKRGVNYWWSSEWVRCIDSSNTSYGRIKAVFRKNLRIDTRQERLTISFLPIILKSSTISFLQATDE